MPFTLHADPPGVFEFTGNGGFAYEPNVHLSLSSGSTIEFWVASGWQGELDYDPVILSNFGSEGILYLVSMLRDQQGLILQVGERLEIAPFDFSDGNLHHVVVQDLQSSMAILVDLALVGQFDLSLQAGPSDGLFIGTLDGESAPFVGALAGLRVWQVPIVLETLAKFAYQSIPTALDHPQLPMLLGYSDFRQGQALVLTQPSAPMPPEVDNTDDFGDPSLLPPDELRRRLSETNLEEP